MIYVAYVLQWLHVGPAVAWFGTVLYQDFLLFPVLARLEPAPRAGFLSVFSPRFGPVIAAIAGLTILTGIGRGLVLGIDLRSAFGITFVAAILVAVFLAAYGARVLTPALQRGLEGDLAAFERLRQLAVYELAGFLVIFTMMIAMRFGY